MKSVHQDALLIERVAYGTGLTGAGCSMCFQVLHLSKIFLLCMRSIVFPKATHDTRPFFARIGASKCYNQEVYLL